MVPKGIGGTDCVGTNCSRHMDDSHRNDTDMDMDHIINVEQIIKAALQNLGCDALMNQRFECSCMCHNLAPCGRFERDCKPGHLVTPNNNPELFKKLCNEFAFEVDECDYIVYNEERVLIEPCTNEPSYDEEKEEGAEGDNHIATGTDRDV